MKILESNQSVTEFMEAWGRSFSQIFSQAGIASPMVEMVSAEKCVEAIAQMGQKKHFLVLNGGGRLNGLAFILPESGILQLGQTLMSEPANPSAELTDTYLNASAEFVRQTAEHARPFCGAPGRDKIEVSAAGADHSEGGSICGGLQISQENVQPITIVLVAPAELAKSMNAKAGISESQSNSPAGTSDTMPKPVGSGSNLDFLFDVKLDATIRFGERSLLLRDILQLGSNSVIELDRQISDPADLIVAGRVVAKGEIVVVNGNFGLKVTEVVNNPQNANLLSA